MIDRSIFDGDFSMKAIRQKYRLILEIYLYRDLLVEIYRWHLRPSLVNRSRHQMAIHLHHHHRLLQKQVLQFDFCFPILFVVSLNENAF